MYSQKINLANVEEKIKPVYQSTIIPKRIVRSSVPKFVHSRNKVGAKVWLHADNVLKKSIQENTSSSCIHVSPIDQGATRLGGL